MVRTGLREPWGFWKTTWMSRVSARRRRGLAWVMSSPANRIDSTRSELDSITIDDEAAGQLADHNLPEGIFAHQDVLAAGLLMECRQQGVRVPEDVAIVGFDDGELAEALDITTARQPLEDSGRLGLRQLREAISGIHGAARHVTLGVDLVVRATT